MENQTPEMSPEELLRQTNIGIKPIGIHKYQFLKTLKQEELSEEQKKQIDNFENRNKNQDLSPEKFENLKNYLQSVRKPQQKVQVSFSALQLWNMFIENFEKVNQKPFVKIGGRDGLTVKNLEPLLYYFSKDDRFFKCENLSRLSVPSFDKGLLIIGNYGNGKTSTMKVFEHIFKGVPGYTFNGFTTNEAVTLFEKCKDDIDRDEFEKKMWLGTRYFDDLKTERIASNFGKVNLFKEILEERYSKKSKTYCTANFKDGFKDNIEEAVFELSEKYGERVYDRAFEMFNIIEFKGESFRK
jgi:hypothetical protein